jgi:GNAT superfamily N-acetyltransferase
MDMLVKLYPVGPRPAAGLEGVTLRKPIAAEYDHVVAWVSTHFSPGWASEARAALAAWPISLFIAVHDSAATLLGFCCWDTTARGFVGPIGVIPEARGTGVGAALLHACLADMRAMGYAYAIAGHVGAPDFFHRVAGAIEIPDSTPGIYRGMLRPDGV